MSVLNVKNRTIFCRDNLDILKGFNSNCIDLIYIDPPFNKNKVFTAPIGSSSEGASFKDYFREEDVKDEWVQSIKEDNEKLHDFLEGVKKIDGKKSYNYCYLCYMAVRIIEIHRVLKDTGSFYFHCDSTMSHYLKLLLDIIFGEKNFRNEIVWKRHVSGQKGSQYLPKRWGANTDYILYYSKSLDTKLRPFIDYTDDEIKSKFKYKDENGERYQIVPIERGKNKGERPNLHYTFKGVQPPPYPNAWSLSKERMQEEYEKGNIILKNNRLERRKYLKDSYGRSIGNDWFDVNPVGSNSKERTGYPTQKPVALLERIIKASSKEGDIVLDAFCGCCTTMIASEKLNRKWVGIDISVKAYELVKERLSKELEEENPFFQEVHKQKDLGIIYTHEVPKRTDIGEDSGLEKKYVYVISHKKHENYYKVGIAKDYKSRWNSYQTADPEREYKLEFYYHTENFREIEKYIHSKFENKFEWVSGNLQDIIKEIKEFDMSEYNKMINKEVEGLEK